MSWRWQSNGRRKWQCQACWPWEGRFAEAVLAAAAGHQESRGYREDGVRDPPRRARDLGAGVFRDARWHYEIRNPGICIVCHTRIGCRWFTYWAGMSFKTKHM